MLNANILYFNISVTYKFDGHKHNFGLRVKSKVNL